MPNKNFNNLHKSPPSTTRPESAVYPSTTTRQALYPASAKNTDAIENPGATGSGKQSYPSTGQNG